MRPLAYALCLSLAVPALAGTGSNSDLKQVNVAVGSTTTIDLNASVSKVTVSDPSVVEVRANGRKVTLVGTRKGSAEAVIQTRDGKMRLGVYVASDRYALPYN